nr:DUF1294 domain-containing protein [Halobacillus karajensis]
MLLIGYAIIINLLLFVMMGVDKRRSKRGSWRIREKKLWIFAMLGGAFGGWLGMSLFRHKTKHSSFQYGFPALTLFYIALVVYLLNQFYL